MPLVWYDLPLDKQKPGSTRILVGADVHGAVADVCYRSMKWGVDCMPRYEPTNRRTAYQQTWRAIWARHAAMWQALSPEQKAEWKRRSLAARARPRWASGYAYFMSKRLKLYLNRGLFTVNSSKIGTDYILYGGLFTIGTSLVASGDKIP